MASWPEFESARGALFLFLVFFTLASMTALSDLEVNGGRPTHKHFLESGSQKLIRLFVPPCVQRK